MKKYYVILIFVLTCILIWFVLCEKNVQNVFDEMYYSSIYMPVPRWTLTSFKNMEIDYTPMAISREREGHIQENLKRNYAFPDRIILIDWNLVDRTLEFCVDINVLCEEHESPEALSISYLYDLKKRTMDFNKIVILSDAPPYKNSQTENRVIEDIAIINRFLKDHHLTEEDFDKYQQIIWYEKIFPDWFASNGNRSKFSLTNLGDVKFVTSWAFEQ